MGSCGCVCSPSLSSQPKLSSLLHDTRITPASHPPSASRGDGKTHVPGSLFLQVWALPSSSQCHQYCKKKKSLFLLLSARSSESHSHLQALVLSQNQPPLFLRPFHFALAVTSAPLRAFLLLSVPPFTPPPPRPWLGVCNLITPAGEGVYNLVLRRSPRQCWTKGSGQPGPR